MWRGRWLSWLPGFCSLGPAQRSQYEEEEEEAAAAGSSSGGACLPPQMACESQEDVGAPFTHG